MLSLLFDLTVWYKCLWSLAIMLIVIMHHGSLCFLLPPSFPPSVPPISSLSLPFPILRTSLPAYSFPTLSVLFISPLYIYLHISVLYFLKIIAHLNKHCLKLHQVNKVSWTIWDKITTLLLEGTYDQPFWILSIDITACVLN